MIRHFHEADKEIPVWALFEVMTLGNFGAFYECLDVSIKDDIEADVGLPSNYRAEQLLKDVIFLLHDFRNAIAHNGVILDGRFRQRNINASLTKLIKQETGIDGVDFTDITDYAVLLVYLMKRMGFTKTECRQLIAGFESTIEKYRQELPFNIYSRIIKSTARRKLTAARHFVSAL